MKYRTHEKLIDTLIKELKNRSSNKDYDTGKIIEIMNLFSEIKKLHTRNPIFILWNRITCKEIRLELKITKFLEQKVIKEND